MKTRSLKLSVFVLLICSIFITCSKKDGNNSSQLINPLLKEWDPSFEVFKFNGDKEQQFVLKTGTKITIPANAIIDETGKLVKGEIELKYREFADAIDVALSGIPMQYRKNNFGSDKLLTTAGMFEINAEQNGKSLKINPDKKIKVEMASFNSKEGYKQFYFDKEVGDWIYIDDDVVVNNPEKELLKKKVDSIRSPFQYPFSDKFFVFNYDEMIDIMFENNRSQIYDYRGKTHPKVKEYNFSWIDINCYSSVVFRGKTYPSTMMLWKTTGDNVFPKWTKQQDAALRNLGNNKYQVTVISGKKSYSATIEAVLPLSMLFKYPSSYWKKYSDSIEVLIQKEEQRLEFVADVYRTFELDNFGIYNCDKFWRVDNRVAVNLDFITKAKGVDAYEIDKVVLIGDNNNYYINLTKDTWKNMTLSPDSSCKIITVFPDNKIGYFSTEEFRALNFAKFSKDKPTDLIIEFKNVKKVADSKEFKKLVRGI